MRASAVAGVVVGVLSLPVPMLAPPLAPAFAAPMLAPLVLAAHAGVGGLSQPVDLRPRFELGQEQRLTLRTETRQTLRMGREEPAEQAVEQELGLLLRCVAVGENGGAEVDMVYESIRVRVRAGEVDLTYDSRGDAPRPPAPRPPAPRPPGPRTPDPLDPTGDAGANPLAEALKPLVGSVVRLTIDRNGNILQAESRAGLVPLGPLGQIGAQLHSQPDVQRRFNPIMSIRRQSGEARVGDSWTTSSTVDTPPIGPITVRTDYTLRAVRAGLASIDFDGEVRTGSEGGPPPGAPGAPGALPGLARVTDSSVSGNAIWDTQRGRLRSMESTQRVRMELQMAGEPATLDATTLVRVTDAGGVEGLRPMLPREPGVRPGPSPRPSAPGAPGVPGAPGSPGGPPPPGPVVDPAPDPRNDPTTQPRPRPRRPDPAPTEPVSPR